jgi:hypothetical protein
MGQKKQHMHSVSREISIIILLQLSDQKSDLTKLFVCFTGLYSGTKAAACSLCTQGNQCNNPAIAPTACGSGYYSAEGLVSTSYTCLLTSLFVRSSWSWSYGSWINNYLCNQCLSPLKLWVRIPLRRGILDQYYVIKFVSNLWQFGGFLWALRFPPPIKLTTTI